ncbi:NAD(P)-dependent dehydrogenase (short-subunit alcohol dehydrogenase family) [Nocardioides salarius]|uniref:NAD(P)-dependent dehydrogenase (Short-subunit alcohol dehydrogenase family) n=1 Tax=Nocardioides salarius TaxID=374513 RepID=A0ABS2M9N8_9ACTN|nr:SDR family oxidoreductase [Nocardioides salarius]MBM7507908.1 NAD(P)-dependent dehydrogenase (short-subunit alcohol dehydrogenase family) [Nocardioides salarius]
MNPQSGRLDGKVALVTGAAVGIGLATARLFAAEGATVLAADVDKPEPGALLVEGAEEIEYVHLDVTDEHEWERVVVDVVAEHGRLDVLVNNAGVIDYAGISEVTLEDWNRVLGVDQTGVFLGTRTALAPMRRQRSGSIVNLSSAWGVVGSEGVAAYQAAKGAVRGLTRNTATTYARDGIRANTVIPGWITTPLTDRQPDQKNAEVIGLTPLGFGGAPEDIAWGCVYLASDESRYVTGSELVIDGGLLAR